MTIRGPPTKSNNTLIKDPIPIIVIIIFCICGLLSFSMPAFAISIDSAQELSNGPSNLQTLMPKADKFGVEMLYPTKAGGQEWYMDMVNPTSDGRFNPQDQITRNPDGSWKMKSDQVRMYVYTSNGYNPNQITSASGQSKVAARGFMGSPQDWRDVEITGFVKLNAFTENDNFVWYARGGKHTDSDHCQGSAYKGNLFYHGETQFSKEQWHVSYAKSPTITATSSLSGKWIGFKFVVYNFLTNDGRPAVKLENWIDANADGKNWVKVYEGGDAGKWGRSGAECRVKADQMLTWGGPLASFRWDFARDVDFRNLSVREITGENGTALGIRYFTGTSTSSSVPQFGNSLASSTGVQGDTKLLNEALGNRFALGNQVNRSFAYDLAASPNSNNWNNVASGESFDQQQVVSGANVYVLWVQGDEDNTDLYLKTSHDGGVTFGNTINLSNNPASLSYHPKIVASGENVYIVWEDDEGNSGNSDIFFMKSSDAGKSFTGKSDISNDPSGSGTPQLTVSGDNVYVAWMGTSPDNTDVFLAQSSNVGNSFTAPENLSNDPDLSFNPLLSVNGTHIFVQWTDQDDNGLTRTESKTLPRTAATYGSQINASISYADLFGNVNSTDAGLGILLGQNSTYANGNESKQETQPENMTESGTLNKSSLASNSDAFTLGSNSNSSLVVSTPEILDATTIQGSNLDNLTDTKNMDVTDLSLPTDKPKADKIGEELNIKINNTLADTLKENKLSKTDVNTDTNSSTDRNPEKIKAEMLVAVTAAEEALKVKEGQKLERNTSSYEKPHLTSTGEGIKIMQPLNNKEQKQTESIATALLDTAPTAESLHSQDNLVSTSKVQSEPQDQKQSQLEVIQGQGQPHSQPEQVFEEKQQQKETQQQRPKGNTMPVKDKTLDSTFPVPDSNKGNKLLNQLPDQSHVKDVEQKKITNLQIQKMEDKQKTINQKRFIKSEHAKEQRQKNEARDTMQSLIRDADAALKDAKGQIKQSNLANQKAHDAIEEIKGQRTETPQQDQEKSKEIIPQKVTQLINEAKISAQIANDAVKKYDDLRRAADKAVEEFMTKFG